MIIEKKKIADLKPAPYNPRSSNKRQEQNLKDSLTKFGVVEPIIFNKQTGYIVGGHFRVRELKKLGFKEVECVIVDLSEEDERELNIRLNANTGSWDMDILANNFDIPELKEWGLELDFEKDSIEHEDYDDGDDVEEQQKTNNIFPLSILLTSLEYKDFQLYKKENMHKSDTDAFRELFKYKKSL